LSVGSKHSQLRLHSPKAPTTPMSPLLSG